MKAKRNCISRRDFMRGVGSAGAACTIIPRDVLGGKRAKAPSDTLNIAGIGVGNRGARNLKEMSSENIVALCDVDEVQAAETFQAYPGAKRYRDFRIMLEKEGRNIDAVMVATPDHTHATAALMAIEMGKHVYCEKPLAHSVYEVRTLTEAARRSGVQTQMGNQLHSSEEIRQVCEWIRDGAIGAVSEVYAWSDRPVGGNPWSTFAVRTRPEESPPVPKTLDWDLWLGPAPYRPYHPAYCPTRWRAWIDFGTGALGDMGCHILDAAFWALNLGSPISVQATTTHWVPEISAETYPRASIVRYEFAARGAQPPVKLTWSDGRLKPPIPGDFLNGEQLGLDGCMFVGERGTMITSLSESMPRLFPESRNREYQRPPRSMARVEGGHHQDWIRACKEGIPPSASFDYGGPLTETVLLGLVAMRVKDQRLIWDAGNLSFRNNDQANELIRPSFRKGWGL